MSDFELRGVHVPLVTPFDSAGEVDKPGLRRLVDYLIDNGAQGLVPCGTTGESPTLSWQEHEEVIHLTIEYAAGRVPVTAGTGSNCTREAIEMTQFAEEAGAQAVLLVSPYYNRPTQPGLIAHFKQVAGCTSLPVVLYNIPKRTGVNIEPDTMAELAQVMLRDSLDAFVRRDVGLAQQVLAHPRYVSMGVSYKVILLVCVRLV